MFITTGIIASDRANGLKVRLDNEIVKYYLYFVSRHFNIAMSTPMHGAHVTIVNPQLHKKVFVDRYKKYVGREVQVAYDPEGIRIGGSESKGFWNAYIPAHSQYLLDIKRDVGAVDGRRWIGLHITIGNTKNLKKSNSLAYKLNQMKIQKETEYR